MIVENFETASGGDFAHSSWVKSMMVIAVSRLHEYCAVREALGIHLSSYIVQMHSLPNMPPSIFNGRISVHIGQETQTEPVVVVVWWVSEAVNDNTVVLSVVHLSHPAVEFVVGDAAPVL